MTVTSNMRKNRAPLGLVLLAVVVGGCSGTTYGTGVPAGRQTVSDLTGIVTLGKGKDKEEIEYAPRAGIVAPPTTTAALPKPGEGTPADNWPVDPSGTTEKAKKSRFAIADERASGPTDSEILSDPGIRLPSNNRNARVYNNDDPDSAENQMRQMQSVKKDQKAIFAKAKASRNGAVDAEGNPVRTTLTEPPATYRIPDPDSQDEFFAAKDEKWWQFRKKKKGSDFETKDEDLVYTDESDIRQ